MASRATEQQTALPPSMRWVAACVLAMANFMVMLDLSIANVSIPHISGDLGITPSQGTWVITSYAVAEAICVPLTGWLAGRFGTLRMFTTCVFGFGLFSLFCGLSPTLSALVAFRIGQGICGAPLMPLSQTLLLRAFPPHEHGKAMGIWAMTVLIAPASGPILGGIISDHWSWHWIFLINIPVAVICGLIVMPLLSDLETPTKKLPIDKVGFALLVFWIGSLQLMMDFGRERDWFADPTIVMLAIFAFVGFIAFIIWELTDDHPIVDLRIFRHRGFTAGVFALSLCFGAHFSSIVIIPQWMQLSLGYTATWAGIATALTSIAALIIVRPAGFLVNKIDVRYMMTAGVLWLSFVAFLRTQWWTSGTDFWTLAFPQFLQGFGLPLFMIPLTTITLGAVNQDETASAAGMQNFLRTMAIAISTSMSLTFWEHSQRLSNSELAGRINADDTLRQLRSFGLGVEEARRVIDQLVGKEAMAMAVDHVFYVAALILLFASAILWISPKPTRRAAPSAAH